MNYICIFFCLFYSFLTNAMSTELQFADKTVESGLSYPDVQTWGLSWGDYDNDGRLNLLITNDKRENVPSVLFKNIDFEIFADATDSAGLPGINDATGVLVSDNNGDGFFDLMLKSRNKVSLFVNNKDSTFDERISLSGRYNSGTFGDYDNDGDLDLYVVYSEGILNAPNMLYENDGQGHFHDVTADAGAQAMVKGRGETAEVADYNNDGLMDIMVLNGFGTAPFYLGQRVLLENTTVNNNKWIKLDLIGKSSNRDAIGSIVSIDAGSLRRTRQQTNARVLHFGLGNSSLIDSITVRWPSGIVKHMLNVNVNQRLIVEEQEENTLETMSLSKAGTGTGTVTTKPGVVSCNTACTDATKYFAKGVTVTLSATPAANSSFFGWSGACKGQENCTVKMDEHQTITATFKTLFPWSMIVPSFSKPTK